MQKMATQVVSNQQQNNNRVNVDGSTDNSGAGLGPSYANAVLKLAKGTRDSDKENISDYHVGPQAVDTADYNVINKMTCLKDEDMAIGSSPQDDGESFTTVTNHHSRKERKKEERFAKRQAKSVNGAGQPGQKEYDKNGEEKSRGHEKGGNNSVGRAVLSEQEQDGAAEKKVFVEAPLPKVNPWQANRNAAQVLLGQPVAEKRVLQNISGVLSLAPTPCALLIICVL